MNTKTPSLFGRDCTWQHRTFGRFILLSQADYALLQALHPLCAVCGKPVDRFEYRVESVQMVFTAYCHGNSESSRLNMNELRVVLAGGVQGGTAFEGPRLLEINE